MIFDFNSNPVQTLTLSKKEERRGKNLPGVFLAVATAVAREGRAETLAPWRSAAPCASARPQTGTTVVPLDGSTRVHRRGVPRRRRHLFIRSPPAAAVAQVAALREERRGENEKWGLGLGANGSAGFDLAIKRRNECCPSLLKIQATYHNFSDHDL